MKQMNSSDIPAFVEAIIDTGCDIMAVGGLGYVIGDSDLDDEEYEEVASKLSEIGKAYGERDHLLLEIVDYLTSIGRNVPLPTAH